MNKYTPGTCNIGASEKRARVALGVVFAVVSVLSAFLLRNSQFGVIIFIPLFISALGFFQARRNFCVYYGLRGEYNFNSLGNAKIVLKNQNRKKDINSSLVIIFTSAVVAAAITVVFVSV